MLIKNKIRRIAVLEYGAKDFSGRVLMSNKEVIINAQQRIKSFTGKAKEHIKGRINKHNKNNKSIKKRRINII